METNIILVGMPASGKTTIGALLAKNLPNYSFIDTDAVIEKTQGLKIYEIFEKFSEDYFRKLEYDTIKMVCKGKCKIISIGGGAFENPDNRSTLLNFGKVFYLKSDLDVLYYRVSKDQTRPLLQVKNPKEALKSILEKREENYHKANYIIDTSNLNEDEIIKFILEKINETDINR